jgi:type IV pilus assembly protein PilO
MGIRNAARLWVFGGAAVVVLLAVGGWFLLIGPEYTNASDVHTQVDDTRTQLIALQRKIAGLEAEKARLPQFRAALRANQAALPSGSGVPDFLRQLQSSGEQTGVTVSGVSVAAPAQTVGVAGVWQLQMTLNAEGDPANLGQFLNRLQAIQPRAVLIQSVNLADNASGSTGTGTSGGSGSTSSGSTSSSSTSSSSTSSGSTGSGGSSSGKPSLSLSLMAYVSPPTGSGAPIVTTK